MTNAKTSKQENIHFLRLLQKNPESLFTKVSYIKLTNFCPDTVTLCRTRVRYVFHRRLSLTFGRHFVIDRCHAKSLGRTEKFRPLKAFSISISVHSLKSGLPHRPMGRTGPWFSTLARGPGLVIGIDRQIQKPIVDSRLLKTIPKVDSR